jgi:hypothetical protein
LSICEGGGKIFELVLGGGGGRRDIKEDFCICVEPSKVESNIRSRSLRCGYSRKLFEVEEDDAPLLSLCPLTILLLA